jgi:uncharacterized protein (TIGR03437 family)
MSKPSNRVRHRACLFLTLVGLMSGAVPADRLWSRSALAQAVTPQATNPGWSFTGGLNTPRIAYSITPLPSGKILVAGGVIHSPLRFLDSAELYDPATGTWTSTGSMNIGRESHTATLLPNGKVLIAGGGASPGGSLVNAELYDPVTGTWSTTGSLNIARASHTATLLPSGEVLVIGGLNQFGGERSAELYDPITARWRTTAEPHMGRVWHTATLLANDKVLVVGGGNDWHSSEIYDPATGRWSRTGNLNTRRAAHMAVLLPGDKVLVMGGINDFSPDDEYILTNTAELYDPVTGVWNPTGNLHTARDFHVAASLLDGRVLVVGGIPELYDPVAGRWEQVAPHNQVHAPYRIATLLPDGKVLATGYGNSAELFDPGLSDSKMVSSVSAASFGSTGLTGETIAAGFGTGLATTVRLANTFPLPTQIAGTSVRIKDSAGEERFAPLFFVSPSQVNYLIPEGTVAGAATVTITSGDGVISRGAAIIRTIAPSLFTANSTGEGTAAALALRVKPDGSQSYELIAQLDEELNRFVARPIDLGPEGEQVYLVLFGTGIRHRRSLSSVIAAIGGEYAEVSFVGAHPQFLGLDQVNVLVPRSLAGRGEVDVLLTVEARMANPVRIQIK